MEQWGDDHAVKSPFPIPQTLSLGYKSCNTGFAPEIAIGCVDLG
jgi:hypothetical protein